MTTLLALCIVSLHAVAQSLQLLDVTVRTIAYPAGKVITADQTTLPCLSCRMCPTGWLLGPCKHTSNES